MNCDIRYIQMFFLFPQMQFHKRFPQMQFHKRLDHKLYIQEYFYEQFNFNLKSHKTCIQKLSFFIFKKNRYIY